MSSTYYKDAGGFILFFSYLKHPTQDDVLIQFITGTEKALDRRDYYVGDFVKHYAGTEVFLGEYKVNKKEWANYWVCVRQGQIVGAELVKKDVNKFDVAVKYGLTKLNYRKNTKK